MQLIRREVVPSFPTVDVRLATTSIFPTLATTNTPTISLLLYQLGPNAELRNLPPRPDATGRPQRQPLPLELCYMITPWGSRPGNTLDEDLAATQEEHALLGLILRTFYDHSELGPADLFETGATTVWGPQDRIQVTMDSMALEDHYRIWDSSELGYRMSVTYRVRVVGLDSQVVQSAPPVVSGGFGARPV